MFQWPGMGAALPAGAEPADLPLISAFLMVAALFFVMINLVVDLLYVVVDPRLRVRPAGGA